MLKEYNLTKAIPTMIPKVESMAISEDSHHEMLISFLSVLEELLVIVPWTQNIHSPGQINGWCRDADNVGRGQ
jgi:hypothetical protein